MRHLALALVLFAPCCGRDKFVQELDKEKGAVTLARETQTGDYGLLTTSEVRALIDGKERDQWLIVDAMPRSSFDEGRLPGSLNFEFPIEKLDAKKLAWSDKGYGGSQADFVTLLGKDKSKKLLFYCGFVACPRSHNAALWAKKLGYTQVHRHPGGLHAWKGAGHALETAK